MLGNDPLRQKHAVRLERTIGWQGTDLQKLGMERGARQQEGRTGTDGWEAETHDRVVGMPRQRSRRKPSSPSSKLAVDLVVNDGDCVLGMQLEWSETRANSTVGDEPIDFFFTQTDVVPDHKCHIVAKVQAAQVLPITVEHVHGMRPWGERALPATPPELAPCPEPPPRTLPKALGLQGA